MAKRKNTNKEIILSDMPERLYIKELNTDDFVPLISVLGCGGTGSYVLSNLARINATLRLLGRPGFNVIASDNDLVSEYNIGRSMFSHADIGQRKSSVLISRINRFYGFNWKVSEGDTFGANIIISCVDTIKARERIIKNIRFNSTYGYDYTNSYIYIDCGNAEYFGHCYYQTEGKPSILDIFKSRNNGMLPKDDKTKPSCSMREALMSQSMNINMSIGMMVSKFIEETFDIGINYNFLEFNIDSFTTNKKNVL